MATYLELAAARGAASSDPLKQKITVAIAVKANLISNDATPSQQLLTWAQSALTSPDQYLWPMLNYIFAQYNASPIATITGASDTQVQTAVNVAVDTIFGA